MSKNDFEDENYTSKTQRKKEMLELKELGICLIELSKKDLNKVPLDDTLKSHIVQAQSMQRNNAFRRQSQYIGKLLRNTDQESIDNIQAAYQQLIRPAKDSTRRFHELERLRDELISKGDEAIEAVMQRWTHADRQQLRQSVRACQREVAKNETLDASKEPSKEQQRKLFKLLREFQEHQD